MSFYQNSFIYSLLSEAIVILLQWMLQWCFDYECGINKFVCVCMCVCSVYCVYLCVCDVHWDDSAQGITLVPLTVEPPFSSMEVPSSPQSEVGKCLVEAALSHQRSSTLELLKKIITINLCGCAWRIIMDMSIAGLQCSLYTPTTFIPECSAET